MRAARTCRVRRGIIEPVWDGISPWKKATRPRRETLCGGDDVDREEGERGRVSDRNVCRLVVGGQRWVILFEDIQSHMLVVLSVRHNVRRVEDVVGI